MKAGPFSRAETKHLFALLERIRSEDGKRQVRHGDFAAESHRGISVGMDRGGVWISGEVSAAGRGFWRVGAVLPGLKTESDGGSAQWAISKMAHHLSPCNAAKLHFVPYHL